MFVTITHGRRSLIIPASAIRSVEGGADVTFDIGGKVGLGKIDDRELEALMAFGRGFVELFDPAELGPISVAMSAIRAVGSVGCEARVLWFDGERTRWARGSRDLLRVFHAMAVEYFGDVDDSLPLVPRWVDEAEDATISAAADAATAWESKRTA